MKKNVLMRTNILVCVVIVLGFLTTSIISYQSNQGIFYKDVESVAALTSEGIHHQIDSTFIKPVNISLTMANDSLLKKFLAEEEARMNDDSFIEDMRTYLNAYRDKYDYDSVFLASAQSKRYYNFNGLDRMLPEGDPENVWFYRFLQSDEEYSLNIDNDEVDKAGNEITVFINCRIYGADGETIGVVGVGFRVSELQELFQSYEDKFGIGVTLIDGNGTVEISTSRTGYQAENLFSSCPYPELKEQILENKAETQAVWYSSAKGSGYLISVYVENLGWHLVVDYDTTVMDQVLARQFVQELLVIIAIIAAVLIIITSVIRKYNQKISELAVAKEHEHRNAFQKATEQLYENIYEIDITHNRAASEATERYFESLGAPENTPYDAALHVIAEKQIKEEFRQGYLDAFLPESVLAAYERGVENLCYDFMIRSDGETYYWMRITAQLFHWDEDDSVRMMVYRQNIDEEKKRELYLYDRMQKDSLTGLLNKVAAQETIRARLLEQPRKLFAFFILDIDDFKGINDRFGHAAGDTVLIDFSQALRAQFRNGDIVGRIGGDEFVSFMPVPDRYAAERKAAALVKALHRTLTVEEAGVCEITTSIGVAVAPGAGKDFETLYKNADYALYRTKKQGKNGFTIFNRR